MALTNFLHSTAPQASAIFPVTPSATPFVNGICKFVWAAGSGTITFVDAAGQTITGFPVFAGRNDIMCQKITAASVSVYAMY